MLPGSQRASFPHPRSSAQPYHYVESSESGSVPASKQRCHDWPEISSLTSLDGCCSHLIKGDIHRCSHTADAGKCKRQNRDLDRAADRTNIIAATVKNRNNHKPDQTRHRQCRNAPVICRLHDKRLKHCHIQILESQITEKQSRILHRMDRIY